MSETKGYGTTTALLYTRVSSDEQAREGLSLPAQLADTRYYAAQRGWIIGGEYQDILSGTRDDRPQYQALLSDTRKLRAGGRSVVLVVKALDRLGRDLLERARSAKELRALGVATHSVMEGGEVPAFVADMLAVLAQEEVRRLGERVRSIRLHVQGNGWYFPGKVPWGYRLRPATAEERAMGAPKSALEPEPEHAPYVREAFCRIAEGASVRSTTRWLCRLPSHCLGDRRVNERSFRRILHNPTYVARQPFDDAPLEHPSGRWPALIDGDTWLKVQERCASHWKMPKQASGRYLLTGLIRCPKCGGRMISRPHVSARPRYACSGHIYHCTESCTMPLIDAEVINAVTRLLERLTGDTNLMAAVRRSWQVLGQQGDRDEAGRIRELERIVQKSRQRLTDAALKLVDGELDKSGYDLLRQKIEADLKDAEGELERLQGVKPVTALPDFEDVLKAVGGWAEALHVANMAVQREVLGLLIERVSPVRVAYGTYRGDIAWTALGNALSCL